MFDVQADPRNSRNPMVISPEKIGEFTLRPVGHQDPSAIVVGWT
jgi:hypothetical protein